MNIYIYYDARIDKNFTFKKTGKQLAHAFILKMVIGHFIRSPRKNQNRGQYVLCQIYKKICILLSHNW